MNNMSITVLGAGYVGLSTAALFACAGVTVYLVEPNPDRLKVIQSGKSFFFENGLDNLIKHALNTGTLIPTDSYTVSVAKSAIIFSCVGTPDNPDGSTNLSYVRQAAIETANYIQSGSVFVQKSTVPVGTSDEIIKILSGTNTSYISNPEFLREGTAILDTLFFDRIVVGGENQLAINKVCDLYKQLEAVRLDIVHLAKIDAAEERNEYGQYISTDLKSAELIKVTSNAFLALKISFANSIAILADKTNGDINDIMNAVGADKRIGRSFLNAGRGYGGGCFPKDVAGLISSAEDLGLDFTIMKSAQSLNNGMVDYILNKISAETGETYKNKSIAVLGTAFKQGTSDIRQSPGIKIASRLINQGSTVYIYDPQAYEETFSFFKNEPNAHIKTNLFAALTNVDAVIIATDWREFTDLPLEKYRELLSGDLFVDAVNAFSPKSVKSHGLNYIGVGQR